MDPNKWPAGSGGQSRDGYSFGTTGFKAGWQRQFLRSKSFLHYAALFFAIPAAAFAARPLFMGKPVDEETLRERYTYLEEVRQNQKQQLQELLDAAKQGKPGGHHAGQEWTGNYKHHGPWDAPIRVPRGRGGQGKEGEE
jgi:hypothetical protein